MTQRGTRTSLTAAWMAIGLVLVYILFFGGAANFQSSPQARALTHAVVLVSMLGGLAFLARREGALHSPLAGPGLAWLVALAIATVLSTHPEASREALALGLLSAPAYFIIRAISSTGELRPRVEWLFIASTTVFVVAYLLQVMTQWLTWWSAVGPSIPPLRPGDVGLTVGTVNSVALYLELMAPVALALAWNRWHARWFVAVLMVLSLAALLITGSRGAWVGAGAGLVVLVVLGSRDGLVPKVWGRLRGMSRLVQVTALALAATAALVLVPLAATRFAGGDAGRFELWTAAWGLFTTHPIAGAGPGAWQGLRALYPVSDGVLAVLYNAHDSVLQILVDTGLVGLAAGSWLVVTIVRVAWRSIRHATSDAERLVRVAALAGLCAAAVHSIFDTQFHLPAVVLLVLYLVSLLDPIAAAPAGRPLLAGRRVAVAGALVAAGAALLLPIDIATIRAEIGNRALDRGRPAEALVQFETAIGLHDLPVYRLGQAIARSELNDLAGARAALDRVTDREPYSFLVAQQALLAGQAGDSSTARSLSDEVIRVGAYDPTATLAAAVVRWDLGDRDESVRALSTVMARVPSLIWSDRPPSLFDDAAWQDARHLALETLGVSNPVTAAAAAMRAGLADETGAALEDVPAGPARTMLTLLQEAVDTGSTDVAKARSIFRANPMSTDVMELHWAIGFEVGSQDELDYVTRISVPLWFTIPAPPYEIVADGDPNAYWSLRLPRYPNAASGRLGPNRPYVKGMPTIEPVLRPGRAS